MTASVPPTDPPPRDAGPRLRTAWLVAGLWTLLMAGLAWWALDSRLRSLREQAHASAGVRLGAVVDTLSISFQQLAALPATSEKAAFASPVVDVYLTNPIARASRVLAECSGLARGRALEAAE